MFFNNRMKKNRLEKVARTLIDCSTCDCQLFHHLHALAIYVNFVYTHGTALQKC
jgi:hypothetical protein